MKKSLLLVAISFFVCGVVHAQDLAIKTNLLYGGWTLTPNLGVEFGLSERTTLHISGGYNPWNLDGSEANNKKLVHWLIRPEARYWFGERFKGHFMGAHGLYSNYNISGHKIPTLFDKEHRYEGYAAGGGLSYGYLWNWNARWGMEFTVGVGVVHLDYDKYDCSKCGVSLGNFNKTYFGPTHAGINLVYKIGGAKKTEPSPVYVAPIVIPPPAPTPAPITEPAPKPEPVKPAPTTAERLAQSLPFLAPVSEMGDEFAADPKRYIAEHREGSLSIYFKQGARSVEPSYRNNEVTMRELVDAVHQIESSKDSRIVRVIIAGFASPEGSVATNDRLAQQRAEEIKRYLIANSTLTGDMVDIHNGGVDWSGLRKLVGQSNMSMKQQVINIIDTVPAEINYRTNTSRNKSLMDLNRGETWKEMLKSIFPELRNATYIRVYYQND